MLAIDLPVSLLTGLFLADAGKKLLKSDDRNNHRFVRNVVIVFSVFFITPIVFYFFIGWPAWEVNFLWKWQDNLRDSPMKAAISFLVFFITVFPTYIGYLIGKWLIRANKAGLVKVGYILMAIAIGVIVFLTRNITFNIASTYDKYAEKEFYSFWSYPFFHGWLVVTVFYWVSLFICYIWVRLRGRRMVSEPSES